MQTAPDGRPTFQPLRTAGAGDAAWQDGFGLPGSTNSTGTNGTDADVAVVLAAPNGDVYVGGNFTQAGGVPANGVAKWSNNTWSALGTGITFSNGYWTNRRVTTMALAPDGTLYVGGSFNQAGGLYASSIARWTGTAWQAMGGGAYNGTPFPTVYAIAIASNGDVYCGGDFTSMLPTSVGSTQGIAKWSNNAWTGLGTYNSGGGGINGTVTALAIAPNGNVYAGGYFTKAGSLTATSIACWTGTAWASLGTGTANGISGTVYALAVAPTGDVYVGGAFTQAGGAPASNVARWTGTAWATLGSSTGMGTNSQVNALAIALSGDLYVGGTISQVGSTSISNVARWTGTAWATLGTGLNKTVKALAFAPTGKLYVGGLFTAVGDGSKAMSYFGAYDANAVLATSAAATPPAAASASLFPNPAHGTATLRLPTGAPLLPLTLTDGLSRVVRRYAAPLTNDALLDLRGLPAGLYVVQCGAITQRVVVE